MKEIKIAVETYSKALEKLTNGLEKAGTDELYRDGVIQRFEFTFEQFWKTLRLILKHEGLDCRSPRSCIREAFKNGLVVDSELYMDMLDDRTRTSHIYNESSSIEIFDRIKNEYKKAFLTSKSSFEKYLRSL